jgi:multidrug efflux pump subunit AcrA (membrane-fusion protein)
MKGLFTPPYRTVTMDFQTIDPQAAAAQQQAGTAREQAIAAHAQARAEAQAQTAEAAREAAASARQQARDQAQMIRDQAQAIRDVARAGRDMGQSIVRTGSPSGPSPRQEKMMFAGFIIIVLATIVIFQPLVRAVARRLEGTHRNVGPLDGGSAERLQRIEQAVDAMAIEIERISEGQRFTTKLLSSRLEAPVSLER